MLELVGAYGNYIGVFALSFISNSVPFVGVPYLVAVASYIAWEAARFGVPAEVALVLTSALGSTLGKLVVYSIASGFRVRLSNETKENLKYFAGYSRRMALPLIMLFAATPLPDDLLYVPLGIARYPLVYYFPGIFIGKTLMVVTATMYFRAIYGYLGEEALLNPSVAASVVAVTIYITAVIMKMDWKKVVEVYTEEGVLPSIKMVFLEFFRTGGRLIKGALTHARTWLRRLLSRPVGFSEEQRPEARS